MGNAVATRKDGTHTSTSSGPDVCKTPMGSSMVPVPYITTAFFNNTVRNSTNVRFNGKEAVTTHSRVKSTVGTEPGVGKGVSDSGHLGPARVPKGSSSLHINGHEAARHGDKVNLNMSSMG